MLLILAAFRRDDLSTKLANTPFDDEEVIEEKPANKQSKVN